MTHEEIAHLEAKISSLEGEIKRICFINRNLHLKINELEAEIEKLMADKK